MKQKLLTFALLFVSFQGYCCPEISYEEMQELLQERGFAVELKLKADESYIITEDPEIIALMLTYNATLTQSYPGAKNPESLLLYTLNGPYHNEANCINDFLTTGKFEEDYVYEFGIACMLIITSIEENTNSNIVFYPNPVEDRLTVSGETGYTQETTIIIYDVMGNVVLEKKEYLPCELNIEYLSSGIYFIQIFDKDKSLISNKFIKT